jgi:hypothetical protein
MPTIIAAANADHAVQRWHFSILFSSTGFPV